MTLHITSLTSALKNITNNTDFSSVTSAAENTIATFESIKKTTLGSVIGEIKGGIEALTQDIDDAVSAASSNITSTVTRVTPDVPGIGDKLIGDVGSAAADIQALTETADAAVNGFLKEIVSAASPEAIDAALKKAAGTTTQEIQEALTSIADINLGSLIEKGLTESPFGEFLKQVDIFKTQIQAAIGANSELFLVDFGEKLEKAFQTSVNSIIGQTINSGSIAEAFSFVANGDPTSGFNAIRDYIPLPSNYYAITGSLPQTEWPADVIEAYDRMNAAESEFKTLGVELSGYVSQFDPANSGAGQNTTDVTKISSGPMQTADAVDTTYQGKTSDGDMYDFSDIKSIEELESIFRAISRPTGQEIAGALIHWSANFLDQNIGSAEIHAGHLAEGFSRGIAYHLIIRRDGTLQRARPMNLTGGHEQNGNTHFLGFCFIGGVNITNAQFSQLGGETWQYASCDSFTQAQWNSYDQLMRTFHAVFPYAQVAGHYEMDSQKIDPGFDVPGYSLAKFNHANVIPEGDPLWKTSGGVNLETIKQYGGTV